MKVFRKLLSLIIVLALVFSVADSNFFDRVSAATITTAYITGTNVNVREGPSLSHNAIDTVSNITATVLGSANEGNYIWYKITYTSGGRQITGYVRYNEDYIRIVTYDPDADVSAQINAFPESYRDALMQLSAAYPNWVFIPDPISLSFSDAVALQTVDMNKQVSFTSHAVSWRSMGQGSYTWATGEWTVTNAGWTGASREVIAYYMDPRNFLNSSEIYMFLQQSFDPAVQTEEGVKKIIAGTFMETDYNDPNDTAYDGSYSKVIMEAARQSGVSPYIIASKIRQEIGVSGTSPLISGTYTFTNAENKVDKTYYGYYNFFNFNASGSTQTAVITNGLAYAKNNGWNSRSAAIIGGAKTLSNGYISAGQDTYYYQDFNVKNPNKIWHQYAQAVHDARSKGVGVAKIYQPESSYALTFKIPVFTDMPDSVSPKPESNSKKNNYYFSSVSVSGLTPSFKMFTYEYDLAVTGNTTVYVKPVDGATYSGAKTFNLKKGENKVELKVKAETGYTTTYTVNVDAADNCVLTVDTGDEPVSQVRRGDTNGDGQITLDDLANVRLHLLGKFTLSGDNASGADTNSDGKISLDDLANIRLHLLGKFTIS